MNALYGGFNYAMPWTCGGIGSAASLNIRVYVDGILASQSTLKVDSLGATGMDFGLAPTFSIFEPELPPTTL